MSRDPRFARLLPPGAAEASARLLPEAKRLESLATQRWFRALVNFAERLVLPGIQLHYIVRKRFLEDAVRCAIEEGFVQVVVLGAGLDTLALRLHREFPRVSFIELDHPATQRVKRRALTAREVQFAEADLARESLHDALPRCDSFTPAADTIFVAEGLLMYLDAPRVSALFDAVKACGTGRRRFVFTFMERRESGGIRFAKSSPLVGLWLRLRGEPFRWGIERAALPAWLRSRGFGAREIAHAHTLRARFLPPEMQSIALAESESICIADGDPSV